MSRRPETCVLTPLDVWAGLAHRSSFVEVELGGADAGKVFQLTPEAAETLGCLLLVAAWAGSLYDTDRQAVRTDLVAILGPEVMAAAMKGAAVAIDARLERG